MSARLRTAVAAAILAVLPLTSAHAFPIVPAGPVWAGTVISLADPAMGTLCTLAAVTDPTAEANNVADVVLVGPAILTSGALAGTLKCYVQIDHPTYDGSGFAVQGLGTGVIVGLGASPFYLAPSSQVYLCPVLILADFANTTRYWDASSGMWSASSNVGCQQMSHVVLP
jgi:hypothetical protein